MACISHVQQETNKTRDASGCLDKLQVLVHKLPLLLQELLEAEKENQQDIVDVIDEERAKVKANTPITETVFKGWHDQRQRDRRKAAEEKETTRRKKGQLTGREIFMEAS